MTDLGGAASAGHGGVLAASLAGAWAACTAFWFGVASVIWKLFWEPRIEELKKTIAGLEQTLREERIECDRRITQLETVLLLHGPQALRQAMQAAVSETRLMTDPPGEK